MAKKIIAACLIVISVAALIAGCSGKTKEEKEFTELEDFHDADIGMFTGIAYAQDVERMFPSANIRYYSLMSDLVLGLEQGRLDGFVADYSFYTAINWERGNLSCVNIPSLEAVHYGFVFAQTETNASLKNEMDAFIAARTLDGTLQKLQEKWFSVDEPNAEIDRTLTGENGSIRVGTNSECKPFVYMKNGELTGYDIEIIYQFCREYGYGLEITDLTFASVIPGVVSGKFDLGAGGFTITEEREQSVDFSDVYFTDRVVMAVRQETEGTGFLASLSESFEKTFIREDRWQLIVQGIGVTVLITLLSAILGTALGFGIYLLCRTGNPVVRWLAAGYSRLIEGIPVVVLLMILFYVVFGKTDLDGLWVAVVGFALTTGSFVYGTMEVSVGGVDKGQTEAALALGYTKNRAFFRIVLPQAMRQFLPAYKGEIVSLIKGTAVVGYIAVQDLTKMTDIIRSNTYEAFFPLIATAVLYFLLTWMVAWLLKQAGKKFEPKRRRKGQS